MTDELATSADEPVSDDRPDEKKAPSPGQAAADVRSGGPLCSMAKR